ncbi:class I SAM-dependent methyltransferase [Nonomuraea sp. NPDC005983]|uniref:class I SAM-dependent methyltransferase n=1 Tax=Nonomuraea sp. NPDC005983 TaxID=3155595 RepID=UPI0033A8ADA0
MSSAGLFAGTGSFYARFRPGYPRAFFNDLIRRFALDGSGRLLDLGCGTGQLTFPLAEHVAEAIGVDPEAEMLNQAARQALDGDIRNVTWVLGSSADMPGELGRFRLVTMGRSFHWMDREQVLGKLAGMVEDEGGVVIANDGCLARPRTPWQHAIEEVQHRFLGPLPQASAGVPTEPHEAVLARSSFRDVTRVVHEFERPWTADQIIGYLYSTSLPLRRMLGDRRPAFEREITDALLMADPSGRLVEPVTLEVLIARKSFLATHQF